MEVIQGKSTNKKIVIAQEIAFAKVLAGNNKTLRDRAVKKLKKWLTIRGNGKWAFSEEEFMRIWTGLFYCMWMSDKFLIQEELAESISSLIHCFKKNTENALLFIKCFNKRIIMDWEGLDQYRIDKFNMLMRRFLRQTFVYCRIKGWDDSLLYKLMEIFYNVVLHSDNSLGLIIHFISIYPEELAKVSKGKLNPKTVLILIEPFVKLVARSKDNRIQREAEEFFNYLMRQTDTGIEFEEKFNAWKEQGFPGEGPHSMTTLNISNNKNEEDYINETDDDENLFDQDEPLDPRAGSVHVFLPQIPLDINGILILFKKHQNSKSASPRGRRVLKCLCQKYETLKRGKFPVKIKKDSILDEKKKKKQTVRNATKLLKFTQEIDKNPVLSKEFNKISKELEEEDESSDEELTEKSEVHESEKKTNEQFLLMQREEKLNKKKLNKKKVESKKNSQKTKKKFKKLEISSPNEFEIKENGNHKENCNQEKKNNIKRNFKQKKKLREQTNSDEEKIVERKKKKKIKVLSELQQDPQIDSQSTTPNKTEKKNKMLSSWQIQELDSNSPEYYKIETQKIIRLEKKSNESCEENELEHAQPEGVERVVQRNEVTSKKDEILPIFWKKALEKVTCKSGKKKQVLMNPFACINGESKTLGRRISFALDKNMAQENEQYLEEVKNSPKVPFDGSKKPVQSALKSGLAPSPVNPFYRFKKIKF